MIAGLAAAGAAAASYAYLEAHSYATRRRHIILAGESTPATIASGQSTPDAIASGHTPAQHEHGTLRILHLSDMHLIARDSGRAHFLRSLADERPDFVITTGDFVGENAGIDAVLAALEPLTELPGAFVFGSNDYYGSRPKNPFSYLFGDSSSDGVEGRAILDSERLRAGLTSRGWLDLTNTVATTSVAGWDLELFGVDDPHMGRDTMPLLSPHTPGALRIGVTHAPYVRVLDEMASAGADLIFSGHTHGGQVSLPGGRALVTNCDLPATYAHGLFQWPPVEQAPITADGSLTLAHSATAVNLSAGLGTSPYVPLRLFTAPEVILLEVVP